MAFQKAHGGDGIRIGLGCVECADHLPRLVLVIGCPTVRRQEIGRKRDETFERHAARNVSYVRVQATILVNDDDGGKLARGIGGSDEISLHFAVGAGIGDVLSLDTLVRLGDHFGFGTVGSQHRRDCGSGRSRTRERRQSLHETAAIQSEMGIFVIGIDHRLGDDRLVHDALPGAVADQMSL